MSERKRVLGRYLTPSEASQGLADVENDSAEWSLIKQKLRERLQGHQSEVDAGRASDLVTPSQMAILVRGAIEDAAHEAEQWDLSSEPVVVVGAQHREEIASAITDDEALVEEATRLLTSMSVRSLSQSVDRHFRDRGVLC